MWAAAERGLRPKTRPRVNSHIHLPPNFSAFGSVKQAVELAADACGNEFLRARIRPAAQGLQEGVGITEAFTATGAFEPIVLDMAKTGETTGNVDFMLTKIAEFYEEEGKTRSHQFAVALGVLATLVVAIYVAYTVITFYAGYFSGIRAQGASEGWLRYL